MKTSFVLFVSLVSVVSPCLAASHTVEQSNQRLLDESREISVAELATHSTYETGLWAALNDVVYDLTDFVHPGGTRKILKVGGLDATATYLENYPRVHPFSIDEVVFQNGIKRVGVLVWGSPAGFPASAPASGTAAPVVNSPVAEAGTATPFAANSAPVVSPVAGPMTAAPLTAAPVTAAPVTAAPVTAAPVAAAPVAAAPVAAAPFAEAATNTPVTSTIGSYAPVSPSPVGGTSVPDLGSAAPVTAAPFAEAETAAPVSFSVGSIAPVTAPPADVPTKGSKGGVKGSKAPVSTGSAAPVSTGSAAPVSTGSAAPISTGSAAPISTGSAPVSSGSAPPVTSAPVAAKSSKDGKGQEDILYGASSAPATSAPQGVVFASATAQGSAAAMNMHVVQQACMLVASMMLVLL